jgi:hypothetical protein
MDYREKMERSNKYTWMLPMFTDMDKMNAKLDLIMEHLGLELPKELTPQEREKLARAKQDKENAVKRRKSNKAKSEVTT